MTTPSEAVILMAGSGSRLRGTGKTVLKPLLPVGGRPLICYTLDALVRAGITKLYCIVGYEKARLSTEVKKLVPSGLKFSFIENPEWEKQLGISLLAAANHVTAPFLLTMSDHLFENAIVDLLIASADPDLLNLAVDRKLDSIFDLDDATKVETHGDRIVAISKELKRYDAIDTGLFICPHYIFDYLERAKRDGDCSLSDGVRVMAAERKARAIDIGDAWWQDVDTVEMLQHAEKHMMEESNTPRLTS